MKFFSDFKPGGALCIILSTMYRFKSEQRWKKFDFTINKVSCCCDWMLCAQLALLSTFILGQLQERSEHPNAR